MFLFHQRTYKIRHCEGKLDRIIFKDLCVIRSKLCLFLCYIIKLYVFFIIYNFFKLCLFFNNHVFSIIMFNYGEMYV